MTIKSVKSLPALIQNLPFEDYLNMPGFLHNSQLKNYTPGQGSINHNESADLRPESSPFREGTLGHTTVLEFDDVHDRYICMPKVDARTKQGKEMKRLAEQQAAAEGKELMNQDEFTRALRWRENILNDPYSKKLMTNGLTGHNEVSGFWRHELGVDACLRADRFLPDLDIIIDAKFMASGSPESFRRDIFKYRFDIQAAWYIEGMYAITGQVCDFMFLVCEKSWPWNVQLYRIEDEWLENAREDIKKGIDKYHQWCNCTTDEDRNKLKSYHEGILTLTMRRENERNII
jgi:hypothetical protein